MMLVVKRRLGRRIVVIVGLAMATAAIGGLLVLLAVTSGTQTETEARLTRVITEMIAVSFQSFDARQGQHPVADIAAKVSSHEEVEVLDVFDHGGRILWSANPSRRGTTVDPSILREVRTSSTETALRRKDALSAEEIVVPLRKTSSCLPCHNQSADPIGGIHVRPSHHRLLADAQDIPQIAIIVVVLSVVALTILLLYLINRVVVARVSRLVEVMSRAEEGDFMVRAAVDSNDEIGLLASTFNKMLAKITDLRVERIDKDREIRAVQDELHLEKELAKKSAELQQANERLSARLTQLSFLYDLGRDLASELDLDALVDRFSVLVAKLGVPEIAILMFDKKRHELRVVEARGFSPPSVIDRAPFSANTGVPGEAARTRHPVYVPSVANDPRELPYRGPRGTGSVLVVPVVYQDNLFGLLVFSSPAVAAFRDEDRELFVAVGNQAALAFANAQLFQKTVALSNTDGLTGILNRRAMEARLELEWSRADRDGAPLSLILIDIDHFKHYNDQHGHQLGDETLRRVARILEKNVRKVDAAARYGGEEFVIILPRAGKREALEVANKLRRTVEQADFDHGYMQPLGRVTISCGVATAPDQASTISDLITAADEALFQAKEAGRNQVVATKRTAGTPSSPPRVGKAPHPADDVPAPAAAPVLDSETWNDDSSFS